MITWKEMALGAAAASLLFVQFVLVQFALVSKVDQAATGLIHGRNGRRAGSLPSPISIAVELAATPVCVAIYFDNYSGALAKARAGGPAGELLLYSSIMDSMAELRIEYVLWESLPPHGAPLMARDFDVIITDQYSVGKLLVRHRNAPWLLCRIRMLDYWGTPPEQDSLGLQLRQYWTPFPNEWNEQIAFRVTEPLSQRDEVAADQRPLCVIHGKLGRYIRQSRGLLTTLAQEFANDLLFVTTIPEDQFEDWVPTDLIVNLGSLSDAQWQNIWRRSRVLLGLGDPVLAPTPLFAMAHGIPYVFLKYDSPRSLSDLPAHPIHSQHDYLMFNVGAPYATSFHRSDLNAARAAIREAMTNYPLPPFIPSLFTPTQHRLNLERLLVQARQGNTSCPA